MLASAAVGGRESADEPFVVRSGVETAIDLRFTSPSTELAGRLVDPSGQPVTDHVAVLFGLEERYWFWQSRRIQRAVVQADGTFEFNGLPGGRYGLAVLTDLEEGEEFDPGLLSRLTDAAVVVSLRDGQRSVQEIQIRGGSLAVLTASPAESPRSRSR
jgi:hypothetical protein